MLLADDSIISVNLQWMDIMLIFAAFVFLIYIVLVLAHVLPFEPGALFISIALILVSIALMLSS